MIDLEQIKRLYKIGRNLELKDIQGLIKSAKKNVYPAGTYLLKEGSTKKEIHFLTKGLVRIFAINSKGEEITVSVVYENRPLASSDIVLFDRPSRMYFQAYEQTETLSMDFDKFQTILDKHPNVAKYRRNFLLSFLKEASGRVESFVLLSPEERYQEFIQKNPNLQNRIPDKFIAHILGVTPVSLSRIRKRIAEKALSQSHSPKKF
ncbi:MAG: Crp/Fnr family transcriptional regulator [Bacteroidota bacterium]